MPPNTREISPFRNDDAPVDTEPQPEHGKKGLRFWIMLASLSLTSMLSSLEMGIVVTALPSIVADFGGSYDYVWVGTSYNLAQASFQPLVGVLSDVLGRRRLVLVAILLFALGGVVCGGSNGMAMLIAGRTILGLAASGISVLCQIIICDLAPLRSRSRYGALIAGATTVGYTLGPVIGGILVQHASWRWCFYLTLPPAGLTTVVVFFFLRLKHVPHSWREILIKVDWVGNAIFVTACVSSLIALGWAGSPYAWSSVQVLLPLLLGLAGFCVFFVYEARASFPLMPLDLFRNRSFWVAWILGFVASISSNILIFFIVYLQGVLMSSPSRAGVQFLPAVFAGTLSAIAAGQVLARTGQYTAIHFVSAAIMTLGAGLLSVLDAGSPVAMWVIFQIIAGMGPGAFGPTLLPAAQATLPEADVAKSAATLSFGRSLGYTWGMAIPASVFNARVEQLLHRIQDPEVRSQVSNGKGFSHATRAFMMSLSNADGTRDQVNSVFADSLKLVWYVDVAFAGLCCLIVGLEQKVELSTALNTEFGMLDRRPLQEDEVELTVGKPA